ncbi:MAG: hypothetical protein AB9866_11465 [Syntrophobacteraceae bacterium]
MSRSLDCPIAEKLSDSDSMEFLQEDHGIDERRPFSLERLNDLLRCEAQRQEQGAYPRESGNLEKEALTQKYQYGIFRHIYESLNNLDAPPGSHLLPERSEYDSLAGQQAIPQEPPQEINIADTLIHQPANDIELNYEALKAELAQLAESHQSLKSQNEALALLHEELKNALQAEKDEHLLAVRKCEALKHEHELLHTAYIVLSKKHANSPATGTGKEKYETLLRDFELEKHSHKLARLEYEALKCEYGILKHDLDILRSEYEGLNEILSNFLA